MSEGRTVIEVGGHKFEVDLAAARRIEEFRIGDKVKVLVKQYSEWKTYPGFIVGIDPFVNLPTIVVAYIPESWSSSGEVKFAYINAESKEVELCAMKEDDIMLNRETIAGYFDRAMKGKQAELDGIIARRDYFLSQYGSTIGAVMPPIDLSKTDLAIEVSTDEDGKFNASIPSMPGCLGCGDTRDAAVANVREAAGAWIESRLQSSRTVDKPA